MCRTIIIISSSIRTKGDMEFVWRVFSVMVFCEDIMKVIKSDNRIIIGFGDMRTKTKMFGCTKKIAGELFEDIDAQGRCIW